MSLYKGNTEIGAIYHGSTEISKIYKGSTLIYEKVSKPLYYCYKYNQVYYNNTYVLTIYKSPDNNTLYMNSNATTTKDVKSNVITYRTYTTNSNSLTQLTAKTKFFTVKNYRGSIVMSLIFHKSKTITDSNCVLSFYDENDELVDITLNRDSNNDLYS